MIGLTPLGYWSIAPFGAMDSCHTLLMNQTQLFSLALEGRQQIAQWRKPWVARFNIFTSPVGAEEPQMERK